MKMLLTLSPNRRLVPFDHIHRMTGALHKWLGPNGAHDGLSLYSFGWLQGASGARDGLDFPRGARFTVSFHDLSLSKRLLTGIREDPEVAFGLAVREVRELAPPETGGEQVFPVTSPVVVRMAREDGSRRYLMWKDAESALALTRVFRKKLRAAGFEGEHLRAEMSFDSAYPRAHSKLVRIKGISHRGSVCPVRVRGTSEAVRFAWEVGAGELTGSGFGALR